MKMAVVSRGFNSIKIKKKRDKCRKWKAENLKYLSPKSVAVILFM